jgi:HSP20 family protein
MRTEYASPMRLPDLFREMIRRQNEAGQLWGGGRLLDETVFPLVNVWASPDEAIVTAELPGVTIDAIDVTVHQNTLTLRGKRDPEAPQGEDLITHRQERAHGPFVRTGVLPFRVDADKVSAKFERGILIVTLPRPDADKPHKVKITH